MDTTERFTSLVQGDERQLHLDEAALLLAAHAEPGLDVAGQLARLDDLAGQCRASTVDGVCDLLFEQIALRGDRATYDDPRNSFLDQVLDRGLGIPISLSVLTIEIGRRVGVAFDPIGMPGHFLVRPVGQPELLVDPFHEGQRLTLEQCETLFHSLFGATAPFSPNLLETTGPRAILGRMLSNLTNSYRRRGDAQSLVWVSRLRAALPDRTPSERHELSRLFEDLGRFDESASILDELALVVGDEEAKGRLQTRSSHLRARLN